MHYTTRYISTLFLVFITSVSLAHKGSKPYLAKEQKEIIGKWALEKIIYNQDDHIIGGDPLTKDNLKDPLSYYIFSKDGKYEQVYYKENIKTQKNKIVQQGKWELCEEVRGGNPSDMIMHLVFRTNKDNFDGVHEVVFMSPDELISESTILPGPRDAFKASKTVMRMIRIR